MKLYIGNKTYSSWSMRPWVLMRACGIPFDELWVPFDGFEATSQFKQTMAAVHPMATVPVLDDEGLVIGDSLSITEYLSEKYPNHGIWPSDTKDRAAARQLVATMHAGFYALREHCIMNIGVDLSNIGVKLIKDQPALRDDLAKLEQVLTPYLKEDGFLFGAFSAADAFYAPVMTRIKTYDLPVSQALKAYQARVLDHPAVKAWVEDALHENIFLDFEEPYRTSPDDLV